jgi:hypothetical protein
VAEISAGTIPVNARIAPLAEVEQIWNVPAAPGERIVLIP